MILFALLGLPQGDANAAIQRFEQYMAKVKSLSVNLSVTYNGTPVGKASLKMAKPLRLAFNMTGQGFNAGFLLNENAGIELDRVERLYDTWEARGRLFVPNSRMSGVLPISMPRFLIEGSLKGYAPATAKYSLTPNQSVGGTSTDLVQCTFVDGPGKLTMKVWIDQAGKILKFYRNVDAPDVKTTVTYDFSNYVANPAIPAETFSSRLPIGYSPYDIARGPGETIESTKPLPMGSYTSAGSGQSVALKSLIQDKNGLVLVTDPEFASNTELLAAVNSLAKQVPDSALVIVSNRKDAASAKQISKDALYDPTGKELAKLMLPGAPTLYLVNKKGAVVQSFFGFDGKWEGLDAILKRLNG